MSVIIGTPSFRDVAPQPLESFLEAEADLGALAAELLELRLSAQQLSLQTHILDNQPFAMIDDIVRHRFTPHQSSPPFCLRMVRVVWALRAL